MDLVYTDLMGPFTPPVKEQLRRKVHGSLLAHERSSSAEI